MIDLKYAIYLIVATSMLNLIGTLYYIAGILKDKVRPNKVSWSIWMVSPLIAALAALSDGAGATQIPGFMSSFLASLVILASFLSKKGFWKVTSLDYLCGFLSVLALIIWYFTKNPIWAIALAILSDLFALMPTLIKSYYHPESESISTYLMGAIAALASFTAITQLKFSFVALPFYYFSFNLITVFIISRKKIIKFFKKY